MLIGSGGRMASGVRAEAPLVWPVTLIDVAPGPSCGIVAAKLACPAASALPCPTLVPPSIVVSASPGAKQLASSVRRALEAVSAESADALDRSLRTTKDPGFRAPAMQAHG